MNTYLSVKKNSGFVWFHIDVQVGGRDDYGRNEYGVPALLQSQVTPDYLREEKLYMVHCVVLAKINFYQPKNITEHIFYMEIFTFYQFIIC